MPRTALGELGIIARRAGHLSPAVPHGFQKGTNAVRARDFGVGQRESADGVGVASAHGGLLPVLGQPRGGPVVEGRNVAVQRLHGGEQVFEHFEIQLRAAAGQAGENVVDAEQDFLFVQIRGQGGHVAAPALQFDVMPLFDAVHADVDLGARRRGTGDLFAQEEIGIAAEMLGGVDGIVIGDRHQIHAAPLQSLIHRLRIVVALAAETMKSGNVAHTRMPRMDVQVAPHASLYTAIRYNQLNCGKNIRDKECYFQPCETMRPGSGSQ